MPNTPAQIGEGVTMWTTTPDVTDEQKRNRPGNSRRHGEKSSMPAMKVGWIWPPPSAAGGPAYLFYYIEAMTDAAVKIGLPRDTAKTDGYWVPYLAQLICWPSPVKNRQNCARWVTSPGGTTAEAIQTFEKRRFSPKLSIKQ